MREWEARDGTKRLATKLTADNVQFLGSRDRSVTANGDMPAEANIQAAATTVGAGNDDIPS